MKLDYLITGTGRCGTVALAKFLTHIGIPCGHETVFHVSKTTNPLAIGIDDYKPIDVKDRLDCTDKQLSFISRYNYENKEVVEKWIDPNRIKADSSYMAAPYLQHELLKDTKVVHLIRCPINVVYSFVVNLNYFSSNEPQNKWEYFISQHLPSVFNYNNPWERACEYYVQWNLMIEKNLHGKEFITCNIEKPDFKQLSTFFEQSIEDNIIPTQNAWSKSNNQMHEIPTYVIDRLHEISKRYKYRKMFI